jgi:uncharacterized DUF497 family protein
LRRWAQIPGRRGISYGGAEQIFVAHFETECINSRVEFEYDPAKSALNLAKHGIDFQKIQEIWNSKVVAAPSHNPSENRWLAIGSVDSKFWTVIITIRNKKIRIISARRSRKNEIEHYKNI